MAIAEVIKYEGDNSTFIWKHPSEDFNSLTQLIVHESQEAIFFMNGQALDLFGAGRYTLETQNIPKIGKFLNRATGDSTPFHCEVYFIQDAPGMKIRDFIQQREMTQQIKYFCSAFLRLKGIFSQTKTGKQRQQFVQRNGAPLLTMTVKQRKAKPAACGGCAPRGTVKHWLPLWITTGESSTEVFL